MCLFEPRKNLFVRGITLSPEGLHQQETSRRRTIIALLGLNCLVRAGVAQPFDLASMRDAVLADTSWVSGIGDLGLLAWFTAEFAPERLLGLFNKFEFDKAIDFYSDGQEARTKGLAWFLAGISHAHLASIGNVPDLTDVAVDGYRSLLENQAESGIFGRAAFARLVRRAYCKRFGTFSDQIHAIYALATFAKAFEIEEPLDSALSCANSVRALQGDLGEWWFLYDKQACRVARRYPVCSRHQDGTGPLVLLALGELTGHSFHKSIYKGLSWISGVNALGNDLRVLDRGLIWDSIGTRRKTTDYWGVALSLLNRFRRHREEQLSIHFEARPDHYGWLLLAFGRLGLPNTTAKTATKGL